MYSMVKTIRLFAAFILIAAVAGCNESNGSGGDMAGGVRNEFTPIIASFVAKPRPVLGSDAKYHLVYELQLTNANTFTWLIESLKY